MIRNSSILKLSVALVLIASAFSAASADYLISASPDGSSSFGVDDDLDVYLNGSLVYTDGTSLSGTRAPINLGKTPKPGDVLEFVVRDTYGFCTGLSPLYLTCTPGASAFAAAGLPEFCGRPGGNQGVSYDSSFTIPPNLCSALSLTVNPIKVPADGTSIVTATATLVSNDFSGMSGHRVTFSIPPGLGILISSGEQFTDASGVASVTILASKTTGTYQVMASDDAGDKVSAPLTIVPIATGLPNGLTTADTVRRPGETDRQVVERLYRTAIPNGTFFGLSFPGIPVGGILNNTFAALTSVPGFSQQTNEGFFKNVCGGYQGQVLNLLDSLRVNPATAAYFTSLDYGPVQTTFGGHHAAVIYDKGTDFKKTGDVLDPWPHQTAEVTTFKAWNSNLAHFFSGPDKQYPGEYPINGGSYPNAGSKALDPAHPFRPLDPPTDNATYTLQAIVDGPVQALATDPQGRQDGELADGSSVFQLPLTALYQLTDPAGAPLHYFALTTLGTYTLDMTATAAGKVSVVVALSDPNRASASYLNYSDIAVSAGDKLSLPVSYGTYSQPLNTPGGPVSPVFMAPPGLTFASTNPETDVGVLAPVALQPGQMTAGSFVVSNNTGASETISSATLAVSNPAALSLLKMSANGGQLGIPASTGIKSSNVFTFNPPITIPGLFSFGFGVVATMPAYKGPLQVTVTGLAASGASGLVTGTPATVLMAVAPTPTPTPSPLPTHTTIPTHTPVPTPTSTPKPGTPVILSIPAVIQVGASFLIKGSGFSVLPKVNFFVATSHGPVNAGPLTPTANSATQLTVAVPTSVSPGQGFVSLDVVNTDKGFLVSNTASALLEGSPAAGIPSMTKVNGVGLAATSSDPSFATDNVETVVKQGTVVKLGGAGFDTANGVAIDLFCACPGGKVGPFFLNPGNAGLTATQLSFTLPAKGASNSPPTGPGSFVVSNAGGAKTYLKKSNAVSVPIGAQVTVSSVTQSGKIITVNGTGFSTLTVINFFNRQAGGAVNLGGLKPDGTALIPLSFASENKFTFTEPAGAIAGAAYVQALNPPFVPYTSSGNAPGGAFTLK